MTKTDKKVKSLCSLVKKGILDEDFKKYKRLVGKASHVCRKCGRVASDADSLCKPREIKS